MRRTLAALLIAGAALGAAGCGVVTAPGQPAASPSRGDSSGSAPSTADGSASTADPCKLVTQADADALAGRSLQAPRQDPGGCIYTAPTDGPTGQVEVYVGESAQNLLANSRAIEHELTPVSGIGDEAYQEDFAIYFRSGDQWVGIGLVKTEDQALSRTPLRELARKAAARI